MTSSPFSVPADASVALGAAFLSHPEAPCFIPEDFNAEARLMADLAQQFSREHVIPRAHELDAQSVGLMPSLIRRAGDQGFCGLDAPEAYGGLGLSTNVAARVLEFLSLNASFSVTVGISSGISQVGLKLFGTPEQCAKYLPPLTAGTQIGAYALSEPNSGTDALSLRTRADERDGKWILNGTKMWISNAQWADQFLVMAKVGGEQLAAFVVERSTPGLQITREEHKMGLKGSSTARVVLENAEVPLENLLHEPGKGHQVAFNALNLGRFKLAAMSIGPAREAIHQAAIYAQDRRQFGQPIGDFGLIREKFAAMAARYWAAESVTYRTGALVDAAFARYATPEAGLAGRLRAAEAIAVECSLSKVLATEAEAFIVDEALQVFGGYGFTEEFPMARLYRDARVSRIYEGTNEINRVFVADRWARRVREGTADLTVRDEGFVPDLLQRAFAEVGEAWIAGQLPQVAMGALTDLLMLAYTAQSSRIRASRTGAMGEALDAQLRTWLVPAAATAAQRLIRDSITLPPMPIPDRDAIAEAIYQANGLR